MPVMGYHSQDYATSHGKRDFTTVIKVTNQLAELTERESTHMGPLNWLLEASSSLPLALSLEAAVCGWRQEAHMLGRRLLGAEKAQMTANKRTGPQFYNWQGTEFHNLNELRRDGVLGDSLSSAETQS